MNEGNWLKLHRKMLEWEWYDHTNTKVVFIHCLLKANFEKKRWRGIEINAGEFITSLETMASETGLTIKQVRTALDNLEMTKDIDRARSEKGLYTMISVVSWDKYQDKGQANGKVRANLGQGKGKPRASTKEGKEREEGKEDNTKGGDEVSKHYNLNNAEHLKIIFDQATAEEIAMHVNMKLHEMRKALEYWIDDRTLNHRNIDTLAVHRAGFRNYLRNSRERWKAPKAPKA